MHIETPLFRSGTLSHKLGRDVWLKLESAQPTGSFKIRGIGLACVEKHRRGAARFISSSGGNAGIAVAYAGRRLSVPVVVVVPETTTARAIALIREQGADVIVHGASWQEANDYAQGIVSEADAFLHPFDDPLIWRGHATIIDELVRSSLKPDAIVLSVGGGGLLCGVVEGLHRHGWQDVPVIAAETKGADSFAQSVHANNRLELPAITSVATSLGARQICAQAFAWSQTHPIHSVVVTDRAAVKACLDFEINHQQIVEPACGASLALAYGGERILKQFDNVLIIVCGGATVGMDRLREWWLQLQ